MNKRWSIQIPLALLTQALTDVKRAARRNWTGRSWKETIEKSTVCTLWETVRPSLQVDVLDVLHEGAKGFVGRWDQKQSERKSIEELLVRLSSLFCFDELS